MKTSKSKRLDVLLVELGHAPSWEQAQKYVRAGWVQVNQQVIDKPATEVSPTAQIEVKTKSPYVSRGGEKLAGALGQFQIDLHDRICLDGGISTGGFTDCMFQQGAAKVYGIDVGYGQVAWSICTDPRLVLRERTNLRHLKPEDLYTEQDPMPDFAVLDLSFISLTKVLPAVWDLLRSPREGLFLIKPQFEASQTEVGKHGIVRDAKVRANAIAKVSDMALQLGWHYRGLTPSPIQGRTGNQEYLLWLADQSPIPPPNFSESSAIASLELS